MNDITAKYTQQIVDQVMQAVKKEREECAKFAEVLDSGLGNEKEIARAIRARSGKLE